jgi:hypothetical protein
MLLIKNTLFSLLIASGLQTLILRAADPLDTWVEIPKPAAVDSITSIAYGNGVFVAVGSGKSIITSSDGGAWTQQSSPATAELAFVKFVNGKFFIIEDRTDANSQTMVSEDGSHWSNMRYLANIEYLNGVWFGVDAPEAYLLHSTNLTDWEATTTYARNLITFQNNLLRAARDLEVSSDGTHWTPIIRPMLGDGVSVANNLLFFWGLGRVQVPNYFPPPAYTIVEGTVFSYSPDGENWAGTLSIPDFYGTPSRVVAGGPNYVLIAQGTVWHTSDLTAPWTGRSLASDPGGDLAYGNSYFVALTAGRIFRSNPVEGAFAPQIFRQPSAFAATIGGAATLSVGAQGTDPLSYQWRKNGANIEGATSSSYTLQNVTFDNAGDYDVVVTNSAGSSTSGKATLSINFADVHTYSGITLRGAAGDKFLIEAQDQLNSESWTTVTNITLATTKYIWIDYDSADQSKRFFRATYQGH